MKKLSSLIFFLILLTNQILSEENNIFNLNGYKYILIPPLEKSNNKSLNNCYSKIRQKFHNKGFALEPMAFYYWAEELKQNPGLGLYTYISIESVGKKYIINLDIVNINLHTVYRNTGYSNPLSFINNTEALNKAVDSVFYELNKFNYQFNETLYKNIKLNEVHKTNLTYEKIKAYFKENEKRLDEIEGFYIISEYIPLINKNIILSKVAIVQDEDRSLYKMIIIKTSDSWWKEGEVKAIFKKHNDEKSLLLDTEYYLVDKNMKMLISEYYRKTQCIVVDEGLRVYRKIYSY